MNPSETVTEAVDRAGAAAHSLVDGLADRAKGVADDVSEATEKVLSSAKDATSGVLGQLKAAYDDNPVRTAVIAGAVALGAIAVIRGLTGRR